MNFSFDVFMLRKIIEKSIEFSEPSSMCFIDLPKKAFGTVRLWDVLEQINSEGIFHNILNISMELNEKTSTKISVHNQLKPELPVSTGMRLGDSLSPLVFNIVITDINQKIIFRLLTNNRLINNIVLDAVIISDKKYDHQRLIHSFYHPII